MGNIQPNFGPLAICASTFQAYDDLEFKVEIGYLNG